MWSKVVLFFLFCLFQVFFFLQEEWDFQITADMFKIYHFHRSISGPIMLHNMLDLCLDQILTLNFGEFVVICVVLIFAETTSLIVLSAQICIVCPLQQIRSSICEHNCANWRHGVSFGILVLGGFRRVRFLQILLIGMKRMKTKSRADT